MVITSFISWFLGNFFENIFSKGFDTVWDNKSKLSLYYKTSFGFYRNKRVRFSISYLFRVRIPQSNFYLLVYNRRIHNQLQPVGGAYKRFGDDKLFESWGYQPDTRNAGLGTDRISESDLRFSVLGKHVIDVIKWFQEGKERELSANREFKEELLETGILDKELFDDVSYKHLKRVIKTLRWSEFHQCYEVLIYDIMELLPSNEQEEYLKSFKNMSTINDKYALVECEDIQQLRLCHDGQQIARIGEHTKLTINQNF